MCVICGRDVGECDVREVLYFHHGSSREHDPRAFLPEHPDTPERIDAIESALERTGWAGCLRVQAPAATTAELELVHAPMLVGLIRRMSLSGGGQLDPDTFVGAASYTRRCMPRAGPARWSARCWRRGWPPSVGFGPPGTMPGASGRWGSACSTTSRSRPSSRSPSWVLDRCSSSTGTSITATGPPTSSASAATSCSRASTSSRRLPGHRRDRRHGSGEGLGYTINAPGPPWSDEECGSRCSSTSSSRSRWSSARS